MRQSKLTISDLNPPTCRQYYKWADKVSHFTFSGAAAALGIATFFSFLFCIGIFTPPMVGAALAAWSGIAAISTAISGTVFASTAIVSLLTTKALKAGSDEGKTSENIENAEKFFAALAQHIIHPRFNDQYKSENYIQTIKKQLEINQNFKITYKNWVQKLENLIAENSNKLTLKNQEALKENIFILKCIKYILEKYLTVAQANDPGCKIDQHTALAIKIAQNYYRDTQGLKALENEEENKIFKELVDIIFPKEFHETTFDVQEKNNNPAPHHDLEVAFF